MKPQIPTAGKEKKPINRIEFYIVWLAAVVFGVVLFMTVKADLVDRPASCRYVIRHWAPDEIGTAFDFIFERTADQLCPQGYYIFEKEYVNDTRFQDWEIQCKGVDSPKPPYLYSPWSECPM